MKKRKKKKEKKKRKKNQDELNWGNHLAVSSILMIEVAQKTHLKSEAAAMKKKKT